jgi:flagellar protein FlbD
MIRLTRLNNQPIAVNAELIKFVEQAPDTVLTLVTGEKLVVRESTEQVMRLAIEYRRSLLVADVPSLAVAATEEDTKQSE